MTNRIVGHKLMLQSGTEARHIVELRVDKTVPEAYWYLPDDYTNNSELLLITQ